MRDILCDFSTVFRGNTGGMMASKSGVLKTVEDGGSGTDLSVERRLIALSMKKEPVEKDVSIWDKGFLKPNSVILPQLADRMQVLSEKTCVLVSAEDLDSVWVETEEDIPDRLEFIQMMTRFYSRDMNRWLDLLVQREDLEEGGYVAVTLNGQCSRARIDKRITRDPKSDWHPEHNPYVLYEVFMIDIGERRNVGRMCMFYLHKRFVKDATWIVNVRLARLNAFYEDYAQDGGVLDRVKWNKRVLEYFAALLRCQSFVVRFIKKYCTEEGSPWWNVFFLRYPNQDSQPITLDQQIIQLAFPNKNGAVK